MTTLDQRPEINASPSAASAAGPNAELIATRARLVDAAHNILPLLKEHAAQTEENRRLSEPVIEALKAAGLWKMMTPRRHGGLEVDVRTLVEVSSILARGCASSAWVTTLLNGGAWVTGMFSEKVQAELYAEGDTNSCAIFAPSATTVRVEGGLLVTGAWGFSSGCLHAQWAEVGIPIVDDSGQPVDQGLAIIPMSEFTINDTWHVAGMRGTGSNTIVCESVFVPDERILSMPGLIVGTATEPLGATVYHSAFIPVAALILAGPLVGMAQGMLDNVHTSLAKGRGISYTFYEKSAEAPTTQLNLADATQIIDTARLHLFRAADDIDSAARVGGYPDLVSRARVRMDTGYVAQKAREASDILLNVGGAGSFANANPNQRLWRDLQTASRHAVVNTDISREIYGKALLGIDPQVSPLI